MEIDRELLSRQFMQSENDYHHSSFETEFEFYSAVRTGDLDTVKRLYTPLDTQGKGRLSKDDLRNVKYHLVITIAMLCRFCIEGGLDPETAYTISDIYINKCDECKSEESVMEVHKEVIVYYTKQMKKLAAQNVYSKHILMCFDCIFDNIYNGVTVNQIADELNITPQYLSRLFKEEVGVKLSDFIMSKRIQAAENMLRYSEYSPLDIANSLSFSSHSHFIACFRKQTGLTPKQYRDQFFRSTWNKSAANKSKL